MEGEDVTETTVELRTGAEWAALSGDDILDFDGWHDQPFDAYLVDRDEYLRRLAQCTVRLPRPDEVAPEETPTPSPASGKRRAVFLTDAEVEKSQGELDVRRRDDETGATYSVERGSVLGWFVLKTFAQERQLASQAGLLHAAGLEVQRLRAELERARSGSGLVVPQAPVPRRLK